MKKIIETGIKLVKKALSTDAYNNIFVVKHHEDGEFNEEYGYFYFTLSISTNDINTDKGVFILPEAVIIEISYQLIDYEDNFLFINGEDLEDEIDPEGLYRYLFFNAALKPKK